MTLFHLVSDGAFRQITNHGYEYRYVLCLMNDQFLHAPVGSFRCVHVRF